MIKEELFQKLKDVPNNAVICCEGDHGQITEEIDYILFSEEEYDPCEMDERDWKSEIKDKSKVKTVILGW